MYSRVARRAQRGQIKNRRPRAQMRFDEFPTHRRRATATRRPVRRPALDQLVADVRRHTVQVVVCWRLDRLGRNLRHLVMLLDDWNARGVSFVTLGEGIDTSTPA